MDVGLILDGQRSNMNVSDQTQADAGGVEISLHVRQVLGAGVDWRDVGVPKPISDVRNCVCREDGRRQSPSDVSSIVQSLWRPPTALRLAPHH